MVLWVGGMFWSFVLFCKKKLIELDLWVFHIPTHQYDPSVLSFITNAGCFWGLKMRNTPSILTITTNKVCVLKCHISVLTRAEKTSHPAIIVWNKSKTSSGNTEKAAVQCSVENILLVSSTVSWGAVTILWQVCWEFTEIESTLQDTLLFIRGLHFYKNYMRNRRLTWN